MIRSFRAPRIPGLIVLLGCLLAAPQSVRAATEIVATRLTPSSLTETYGSAVPVHVTAPGGTYVLPTRNGVEFRGTDASRDTLYGSFRTSGVVSELAVFGSTAYLFAGNRGIVAVDLSDSTDLVAIGSHDHLGAIQHGAFAPSSRTLAAATDGDLFFFRETAPGALDPIGPRGYQDGRRIVRVQARADSFLVLSLRQSPTPRMVLTLYRIRSGSLPESLWEFQANGFQATDLAWPDVMAFLAVGDLGILPFDTETRTPRAAVLIGSGSLVRDVDADQARVVAVGAARTYANFVRSGSKGGTLGSEFDQLTAIEPFQVSIVGRRAILSENNQSLPAEPDEIGRSLIESFDTTAPIFGGRAAPSGTGRVRRVLADQGLAYVADYSGGLRIYRVAPADTSLVGVLPLTGISSAYDVALDPARRLAYVAAGTAGLLVVDVTDPSAPAVRSSVTPAGTTVAVAVNGTVAVVARRGSGSAGISVVDVTDSLAPILRGNLNTLPDPRAVAIQDTVAYVADAFSGLALITIRNPAAPALIGSPSGFGALDLDLTGTQLLVGTTDVGVQIFDVSDPGLADGTGALFMPTVYGVAQLGQSGVALLGDGGALAIDLRVPSAPRVRGLIQVPGFARDAFWVGDTLLVAASLGLERFLASAAVTTDPSLGFSLDLASVQPRLTVTWSVAPPAGAVGWNLYRETVTPGQGMAGTAEYRVNDALVAPAARTAQDRTVQGGKSYRYRLDAFFADGSSRKAAEGVVFIPSNSALGRPYPNPYRPRNGQALYIPYRVLSVDGGKSVVLRVFEMNGRLVRTISGTTAPGGGFGSMTWDGRDGRGRLLADGVYFLKLVGPGIDDARRLILLR